VPHGRSAQVTALARALQRTLPQGTRLALTLCEAAAMRRIRTAPLLVVALLAAALLTGCGSDEAGEAPLRVQVVGTLAHDSSMYTEGLEIAGGVLYESSGRVGQSRVRGTAWSGARTGDVLGEAALPAPLFGEGITVAGPRLWQLTWTNGIAIERDPVTLAERRRVSYAG